MRRKAGSLEARFADLEKKEKDLYGNVQDPATQQTILDLNNKRNTRLRLESEHESVKNKFDKEYKALVRKTRARHEQRVKDSEKKVEAWHSLYTRSVELREQITEVEAWEKWVEFDQAKAAYDKVVKAKDDALRNAFNAETAAQKRYEILRKRVEQIRLAETKVDRREEALGRELQAERKKIDEKKIEIRQKIRAFRQKQLPELHEAKRKLAQFTCPEFPYVQQALGTLDSTIQQVKGKRSKGTRG